MRILKPLFIIILSLTLHVVRAQQMPLYSQYMANAFIFNPGMTGYDGFTAFNLSSRQQWLGFENAPRTFSISGQTRLLMRNYMIKRTINHTNRLVPARSGRVGLGGSIINDRNGSFSRTGINFSYAYHISFPNSQISFGLSTSVTQFKIDLSPGNFRNKNEPGIILGINEPIYVPDANFGLHYMNRDAIIGLGAANLFQTYIKFGSQGLNAYRLKRTYYFTSALKINQETEFVYEPSILIKATEQLFYQVDLSFKATIREAYWMGISYRSINTLISFFGVHYKVAWIGYAFDYQFSSLQPYSYGSHELFVTLKFGESARRLRWLRRY